MIDWLTKNAPVGSVVLEASGAPYGEFARISSHTGIPTVMGWANHELLWRNDEQEVSDRAALVKAFYQSMDDRVATIFLQRYKVTHVVLGDMERTLYPGADRISQYLFLKPVFPDAGQTFPRTTIVYETLLPKSPVTLAPDPGREGSPR